MVGFDIFRVLVGLGTICVRWQRRIRNRGAGSIFFRIRPADLVRAKDDLFLVLGTLGLPMARLKAVASPKMSICRCDQLVIALEQDLSG